jgi:hypothetical protein
LSGSYLGWAPSDFRDPVLPDGARDGDVRALVRAARRKQFFFAGTRMASEGARGKRKCESWVNMSCSPFQTKCHQVSRAEFVYKGAYGQAFSRSEIVPTHGTIDHCENAEAPAFEGPEAPMATPSGRIKSSLQPSSVGLAHR